MDTKSTPTSGNWTDVKAELSLPIGYSYLIQNTGSVTVQLVESQNTPNGVEPHKILPNMTWAFSTESNTSPWIRSINNTSGMVTVSKAEI